MPRVFILLPLVLLVFVFAPFDSGFAADPTTHLYREKPSAHGPALCATRVGGWQSTWGSEPRRRYGSLGGDLAPFVYRGYMATEFYTHPGADALLTIAVGKAATQDVSGAIRVVERIVDEDWRDHALRQIARSLAEDGDADNASVIADRISNDGCKAFVLTEIGELVARRPFAVTPLPGIRTKSSTAVDHFLVILRQEAGGNEKKAIQIIEDNASSQSDAVLGGFAEMLARTGHTYEAIRITAKIRENEARDKTRREVALALRGEEEIDLAVLVAEGIRDSDLRGETLRDIILTSVKEGHMDRAILILPRFRDSGIRDETLKHMVIATTNAGDIDRAMKLLARHSRPEIRESSRRDVATLVARTGDFEHATEIANGHADLLQKSKSFVNIAVEKSRAGDKAGSDEAFAVALQAVLAREQSTLREVIFKRSWRSWSEPFTEGLQVR